MLRVTKIKKKPKSGISQNGKKWYLKEKTSKLIPKPFKGEHSLDNSRNR